MNPSAKIAGNRDILLLHTMLRAQGMSSIMNSIRLNIIGTSLGTVKPTLTCILSGSITSIRNRTQRSIRSFMMREANQFA